MPMDAIGVYTVRAMHHALVRMHQCKQHYYLKLLKDVTYWLTTACRHSCIVMMFYMISSRTWDVTLSV